MTLLFRITPTHVKWIGDGYSVGEQCKVDEILAAERLKVIVPIFTS